MIEFDLHIRNPDRQEYNTAFNTELKLTTAKSLEITVINKTYTWLKFAFSISKSPMLMLGLCKFVICFKVK